MLKTVQKYKPLKGEITIPADKSISHRAIMLASLAKGESLINNISSGADCRSTLNIFKQLGVGVNEISKKTIVIKSDGELKKSFTPLDAGNSGTTTRLIAGILAGQNFDSQIVVALLDVLQYPLIFLLLQQDKRVAVIFYTYK